MGSLSQNMCVSKFRVKPKRFWTDNAEHRRQLETGCKKNFRGSLIDNTTILMHRTSPKYMIEHASSYTLSVVINRLKQLGGF